jgi:hypothetical protein
MCKNILKYAPLALIGLVGCATSAPAPACAPMVAQICSRAAEAQLEAGTLMVGYSSRPEDSQVVPFVVPVFRQDGGLAAEVDCYADTDSHRYSIVRSDLAIPPTSLESTEFLRSRHLCASDGSYAEDEHSGVQTASAFVPR